MYKKIFNIILIITLLVTVMLFPVHASEVKNLKASDLELRVMPEYDNSQVLVLYAINYLNTSNFPYAGEISFPVPKNTANNLVVETFPNNEVQANIKVVDKGEYAELVWQPSAPILPNKAYPIHIEYYYSPLPATGQKTFTYEFTPNIDIDKFNLQILEPLKATDFKTEPATKSLGKDQQGFTNYSLDKNTMKAGENIELQISYTKNDPQPSIQPQGMPPTQEDNPQQQPPPPSPSKNIKLVLFIKILIITVVISSIIFGIIYFLNRRNPKN